jgi:hypothetical protein
VAGAADALQARGGGRRLDLDHEVDGAHVDAEFELLVATTQRSVPDFSSSSTWARCSFDTEPWCAFASTGGRAGGRSGLRHHGGGHGRSAGRAEPLGVDLVEPPVSRSARRRELANTIVERCASTRSTIASSTCGQTEPVISDGWDGVNQSPSPSASVSALVSGPARSGGGAG